MWPSITNSSFLKVVAEPAMGQSDLDSLNDKCRVLSSEINGLVENRMRSGQDPMDDKLSIFRQQVRKFLLIFIIHIYWIYINDFNSVNEQS